MLIEECINRKIHPKEGDILIIQNLLYQVVAVHQQESNKINYCKGCHLDGKKINNKDCIYTFIEDAYKSCAEFLREPYVLKRFKKKFNGI